MVEREYQKGHCKGPGMASVGGWESLASCALSHEGNRKSSRDAVEIGDMLPMLVHIQNQEGIAFLLGSLQNFGMESRFHGVRVEAIEASGVVPVYDIGVEDAHCAMIGPGIFASNCDGLS